MIVDMKDREDWHATWQAESAPKANTATEQIPSSSSRGEEEYNALAQMIDQADLPQGTASYMHEFLGSATSSQANKPPTESATVSEAPNRRWSHIRIPEIGDPDTEYSEEVHSAVGLHDILLNVTTGLAGSIPNATGHDPTMPDQMPVQTAQHDEEQEAFTADHALVIYNAFRAMANLPRSRPDSDESEFSSAPSSDNGTRHHPRHTNRRDERTGDSPSAQAEWIETIEDADDVHPPHQDVARSDNVSAPFPLSDSPESNNNTAQARQQEDPNKSIEAEREHQRAELARIHDELIEIRERRAALAEANSSTLVMATQVSPTPPIESNPVPRDIEADFGDSSTDEEANPTRFLPGYYGQPIPEDAATVVPRSVQTSEDHTGIYMICPWGYQHFFPTKGKGQAWIPFAKGMDSQAFAKAGKGKPVPINDTMHSSIVAYDPNLVSSAWKLVAYSPHLAKYRRSGSATSLSRHLEQNYLRTPRAMAEEATEEEQANNPGSSSDAPSTVKEPTNNPGSSSTIEEPAHDATLLPLVRSDFIDAEEECKSRGI